jgi:hypothetical protein
MSSAELPGFRFRVGQHVVVASGNLYLIVWQDQHPTTGELRYGIIGRRNGNDYGPVRNAKETALSAAWVTS